jgi:DNA repair protein SbcD/Mre11
MKIVHTSDLHLSPDKPERIKALKNIISEAEQKGTELLLISGDLFDSNQDADILRPGLRDIFSSLPFRVLVIPGNHDMEAYGPDMNFGNSIEILTGQPFETVEFKNLTITGIPYINQDFNDLVPLLEKSIDASKKNILMIHCSLDIPYVGEDEYGDEKRQMYLPVSSKILGNIGFDYILAGHFHSRVIESRISEKTIFIYSGSPVSITRKEMGRRRITFLNTEAPRSERLSFLETGSFYYDKIEIDFNPGREEESITELKDRLKSYKGNEAEVEINLNGFISSGEKNTSKKIQEALDEMDQGKVMFNIKENYRDIKSVLEDPLYTAFKERLLKKDMDPDLKEKIENMIIMQFSKLKTRNSYED